MPALSSAAPRPYRRPSRSLGRNGSLSQAAASPGGCTSWCAYSRTVGAPGGPGRWPSTAGWPPATATTSAWGRPAAHSSAATSRALARRYGAAAGTADTEGIRTSRSRSARTEGSTSRTADASRPFPGPGEAISRTLPGGPAAGSPGVQVQFGGEPLGHFYRLSQLRVADDDHPVGDRDGPPVAPRRAHGQQVDRHHMLAELRHEVVQPRVAGDLAGALGAFEDDAGVVTPLHRLGDPPVRDRFGPA